MRAELCRRQLRQDPVQMTADALRLLAEKFNLTPCSGDPSVLVKVRDDKRAYGVLNTAFGGLRLRLKWLSLRPGAPRG